MRYDSFFLFFFCSALLILGIVPFACTINCADGGVGTIAYFYFLLILLFILVLFLLF